MKMRLNCHSTMVRAVRYLWDVAELTGVAAEPEPDPTAASLEIAASEAELDFGTVVIGNPAVTLPLTLQITNTSGGEVPGSVATALLLVVSNTAFSVEPVNCPDVAPGATESCVVEVTYNPSTAGDDEGALELSFDDGSGRFGICGCGGADRRGSRTGA